MAAATAGREGGKERGRERGREGEREGGGMREAFYHCQMAHITRIISVSVAVSTVLCRDN